MTFHQNPNSRVGPTTKSPTPDFTTGSPVEPESASAFYHPEQPYDFGRQTKPGPIALGECANVLARGSKWQGSVVVEDSIRIDGDFKGGIDSKGTVHIAEGGTVDAKTEAAFVVVSGSCAGEVTCRERLELRPKSKLQGEVLTKALSVEEGAIVDGTIRMSKPPGGLESQ